jgi:hypothetical protein
LKILFSKNGKSEGWSANRGIPGENRFKVFPAKNKSGNENLGMPAKLITGEKIFSQLFFLKKKRSSKIKSFARTCFLRKRFPCQVGATKPIGCFRLNESQQLKAFCKSSAESFS